MAQLHRVVIRGILAFVLLAAPLTMLGWFAACPQYGDPTCPSSNNPMAVMSAFRDANAHVQQLFLLLNLLAPYVYPLSYLVLGLLALKRAPWLATLGMICGWAGGIAWGFIADTMFHITIFAQAGTDQLFVSHENSFFTLPYVLAIATGWVIGHLLGYILLGIALFRSRAIPRWASVLLILSAPVMGPIAYGTNIGAFQLVGYLMVFIASIPAALVLLKTDHQLSELIP